MAFSRVGYTMRWTRSFFRVALNDSAQALSQHTPVRPTEGRILKVIQQASGRISGKRYYDGPLP